MNQSRLDELQMPPYHKVTKLELAARECDKKAIESYNIKQALHYQNAAIAIRKLSDWTPYEPF